MISARCQDAAQHIVIRPTETGEFCISDKSFKSVHLLIQHYTKKKEVVNAQGG